MVQVKILRWHGEWQNVGMQSPEDEDALKIKKKDGGVFADRKDRI
jgi:hypothetical protein